MAIGEVSVSVFPLPSRFFPNEIATMAGVEMSATILTLGTCTIASAAFSSVRLATSTVLVAVNSRVPLPEGSSPAQVPSTWIRFSVPPPIPMWP